MCKKTRGNNMYKITTLLNARPVKSRCVRQHPLPAKAPQKTDKCNCICKSENAADPTTAEIQITYDNKPRN